MTNTCRDEILECVRMVADSSGTFTVGEMIRCMEKRTMRTHITSRMCANAPENHASTCHDFKRTGHGEYQVVSR